MAISSNYHKLDETLYFTAVVQQLFAGSYDCLLDVSGTLESKYLSFIVNVISEAPLKAS